MGHIDPGLALPDVVVLLPQAAERESQSRVIGGYTRCDSNRFLKITANAGRTLDGLHP